MDWTMFYVVMAIAAAGITLMLSAFIHRLFGAAVDPARWRGEGRECSAASGPSLDARPDGHIIT
jgi:hypothetical protein